MSISTSIDDVEQDRPTSAFDPFSTSLDINGSHYVGMRFFVCIPAGATITNASLTVAASATDSALASASIEAERIIDSESFATNPSIIGRLRSLNAVPWTMPTFVSGNSYESPSIAVLIDEIITLPGWTGCGNMLFVMTNDSTRSAHSFDSDPADAPILTIIYEP